MSLRRKTRTSRTITDWVAVDCPGCRRVVLFLPAQTINVCAFCDVRVIRELG